jgi:hypothetical protein
VVTARCGGLAVGVILLADALPTACAGGDYYGHVDTLVIGALLEGTCALKLGLLDVLRE